MDQQGWAYVFVVLGIIFLCLVVTAVVNKFLRDDDNGLGTTMMIGLFSLLGIIAAVKAELWNILG